MAHENMQLPTAQALSEYNTIVTNGAERIFAQIELEAESRRSARQLPFIQASQDFEIRKRAQMIAGVFAFSSLLVTAFAIQQNAHWAAAVIGGGTITMVVTAFLGTRKAGGGPSVRSSALTEQ